MEGGGDVGEGVGVGDDGDGDSDAGGWMTDEILGVAGQLRRFSLIGLIFFPTAWRPSIYTVT